jgi:hypothetical protein
MELTYDRRVGKSPLPAATSGGEQEGRTFMSFPCESAVPLR